MSDLRTQIGELRAQVAALQSPTSREQMIRAEFAEPEFNAVREEIVERLLANGFYSFQLAMPDDEDPTHHPSRFIVHWHDGTVRNPQQKVTRIRISYTSQWRRAMNAGSGRESIERTAAENSELFDVPEPEPVPALPPPAPSVATIASAAAPEPTPEPEPVEIEAEHLQAKIAELRARLAVNKAALRRL